MNRNSVAIFFVLLAARGASAVELYGVTGDSLYVVDPVTGTAAKIGTLDPPVDGLLGGLEWADGTLYGLSGTPGNAFFSIDPGTGTVTSIGPIGAGTIFEGGLAYDGSRMWGVNQGVFGGPKNLISIDLETGQGAVIGQIADGNVDFNGLAVYGGELYGVDRITNALWRIDVANPAASTKIGTGFGSQIDPYPKGGMAGEYAYADASHNFFRVDFMTGKATVLATTAISFRALAPIPCPADVTGDAMVDVLDLLAVLGAWGACEPDCPEDINSDGVVDVLDLLEVLAAWGPCP